MKYLIIIDSVIKRFLSGLHSVPIPEPIFGHKEKCAFSFLNLLKLGLIMAEMEEHKTMCESASVPVRK